jgi:hypothetical protein
LEDDPSQANISHGPETAGGKKVESAVKSTDSLLVFVPGPMVSSSPEVGGEKPRLRLVRPALEIAQPIVPAGGGVCGRARESYSEEILRMALDRMISHAANELLDDATRPYFEEGLARAESAVQGVIEPKNPVESRSAHRMMSARQVIGVESPRATPVHAE